MKKENQDRYLSIFKKGVPITQKEVAERVGVSLTASSRALKFLTESGKVTVIHSPGMSMRYSLNSDLVLRTPKGTKVSLYYREGELQDYSVFLEGLMTTTTTNILNSSSEENLSIRKKSMADTLAMLKSISPLWDLLLSATYEQVEATRKDMNNEGKS